MKLEKPLKVLDKAVMNAPNLTDRFTETDLKAISNRVWEGYKRDKESRSKWEKRYEAAMDLAMQVAKEKTFPWPMAANVIFPLVSIAALQFSSRSYANIIHGTDVVRCRIAGGAKAKQAEVERAARISRHMSWQCLEEDQGWEEGKDRLLLNVAIVGTTFSKTRNSRQEGCVVSEMVPAQDLVVNYWAKNLASAQRKTHIINLYRNDIHERVASKVFRDISEESWYKASVPAQPMTDAQQDNRQGQTPPQPDEDTPFKTLEQHCLLDLDDDGYAEPWIVTIEEQSKCVLRIVARWIREEDIETNKDGDIVLIRAFEYFQKYGFIPAADGGIYDMGFGVLLGPLNESVNTGINQMLDAGTMANSNGGFFGRGVKVRGGIITFAPWEWRKADAPGDDLRKNFFQFPTKEPSTAMFQLISLIINYADRLSGSVDINVGENPGQNTPAQTSRTMVEQGMQVYSSIFKRVWRAMKGEFKQRFILNALYLDERKDYGEGSDFILREDYRVSPDLVRPSADPNITSKELRLQKAQMIADRSRVVAGYNVEEAERRFLQAAEIEGIDTLYIGAEKTGPLPNPKVQLEEAKGKVRMQEKQMQMKGDMQKMLMELKAEQPKLQAEIDKLKAEAASLIASIGAEKAALQVQLFESVMDGLTAQYKAKEAHIKMLTKMMEAQEDESEGGTDGGRVQRVDGASGKSNGMGDAADVPGGPEGAMGSAGVPG